MSSRADERIKRSVLFAFVAVSTLHFCYENTPGNRIITTLEQAPVVQKVDSAIQWITQMNSLILIRRILSDLSGG